MIAKLPTGCLMTLGGEIPWLGTKYAGIGKRSNPADCKSAAFGLRLVRIHLSAPCGYRIRAIMSAFQAEDKSSSLFTRTMLP